MLFLVTAGGKKKTSLTFLNASPTILLPFLNFTLQAFNLNPELRNGPNGSHDVNLLFHLTMNPKNLLTASLFSQRNGLTR